VRAALQLERASAARSGRVDPPTVYQDKVTEAPSNHSWRHKLSVPGALHARCGAAEFGARHEIRTPSAKRGRLYSEALPPAAPSSSSWRIPPATSPACRVREKVRADAIDEMKRGASSSSARRSRRHRAAPKPATLREGPRGGGAVKLTSRPIPFHVTATTETSIRP